MHDLTAEHYAAMIAAADAGALPQINRDLIQAWGRGEIRDAPAEQLLAAIEARRAPRPNRFTPSKPRQRARIFSTGRKRPTSPDKAASQARRRRMAHAGYVPGAMAAEGELSTGAVAVLAVVAETLLTTGRCGLTIAAIAAKAGVCHRLAQTALRQAVAMGWISIEERRRAGRPSLTNLVRIACARWSGWIKKRREARSRGEGAKSCARPITRFIPDQIAATTASQWLSIEGASGSAHRRDRRSPAPSTKGIGSGC